MTYYLYCGNPSNWKQHVQKIRKGPPKNASIPEWSRAETLLSRGLPLSQERLYRNKNVTGLLISESWRQEILDKSPPVVVVAKSSRKGLAKDAKDLIWALARREEDFPQIFGMISRDSHALGFLQLRLTLPKEDLYSFNKHGIDVEGLHLFEIDLEWVKDLRTATMALCSLFLSHVLGVVHEIAQHSECSEHRRRYFPDDFLRAVQLDPDVDSRKFYEKSIWVDDVLEIKECLLAGRSEPAELALGIISHLWSGEPELQSLNLSHRMQAEDTLFFLRKYREHFVHTLKVFLIGQRIIRELYCNDEFEKQKKSLAGHYTSRRDFERLWMIASTIHDWAFPIEELAELQEDYWNKFLLGDLIAPEPRETIKEMLKNHASQVFAQYTICDEKMSEYLQLLHADTWTSRRPGNSKALCKFYNKYQTERQELSYSESLRYLIPKRDHGVAAALWYLNRVLPCKTGDCERKNKKPCRHAASHNLQCINFAENGDSIHDHLSIGHAVFFHNMVLKVGKNPGENMKACFKFSKWPLTYLMILSDVLQDDGRPQSDDSEYRPVGFLGNIGATRGKLVIEIKYRWPVSPKKDDSAPGFLDANCQEYALAHEAERPDCFKKGTTGRRGLICTTASNESDFDACVQAQRIRAHFEVMKERLIGLRVKFDLTPKELGSPILQ